MLRAIEYTLMGASLLVVIGLIVGGSRSAPKSGDALPPTPDGDHSGAHEPGESA